MVKDVIRYSVLMADAEKQWVVIDKRQGRGEEK
jgi:hypothetical protein